MFIMDGLISQSENDGAASFVLSRWETQLLEIPFNKTELKRKTLQLLHSYLLCIWSYRVCIEVINYKAYAPNGDQILFQFLTQIPAVFRNL